VPHALIAALVGLTGALVCAGVLQPVRTLARRVGWLDQPGERRVHTVPVPRLGGLALFFGFLAALSVSFILPVTRFQVEIERILLLALGATIVVGVMVFDDIIGIHPLPKLLLQVGAAAVVVLPRLRDASHGIVIEQFNAPFAGTVKLPLAVALGFTLLWIVGMMNSLNWADGIDGLAGTITLVAGLVLFAHTYLRPSGDPQFTISLLAIALVGAVLGFLPFNWHPARIIMGDCGSMFLGFALATISIIGGAKIATALLALGIPILDMAWLIVYRVINGRTPWTADRGHLHHRLLDAGLSQPQVVLCFGTLTALFGVLALALPSRGDKLAAMIVMGLVLVALITLLALRQSARAKASR
jgi:UDP-N-acetylmuramyl pentapeptide phosphotransferase/UDP-N-acetylglucosamine-1-phosphate transferase